MKYLNPEDAGWSMAGLRKAHDFYKKIGSDALLVLYKGVVLVSWGEVERRFLCHSMRKALMNAMIGIYAAKEKIDINKTLKELNIDDDPPLTGSEKNATVLDLLKSRSGIYLPAQYEDLNYEKPKRGTFKPGKKYFYNNWDFNSLLTIFENETGKIFFEEFARLIARPLQMEEFRTTDGYYHLEKNKSIHPAYPIRMSAKDLARFGFLYLNKGNWNGKQVIPMSWIAKSIKPYSFDSSVYGYFGLLWFISGGKFRSLRMYSTMGNGGHGLSIIPKENLLFVHRVNTYKWKHVTEKDRLTLLQMILRAKAGKESKNPGLVQLVENKTEVEAKIDPELLDTLPGVYRNSDELWRIKKKRNELIMFNQFGDGYRMLPQNVNSFLLEDSLRRVHLKYLNNKSGYKLIVNRHPENSANLFPV
jgi:hypothetical protein